MAFLVQHYISYTPLTAHGRLLKSDKTKDYLIQYSESDQIQCTEQITITKMRKTHFEKSGIIS